jgi:hypothetical protein
MTYHNVIHANDVYYGVPQGCFWKVGESSGNAAYLLDQLL